MKCIFLSDAHLKSERDKGYRDMMRFLDSLGAEKPDQLFVAGDFFDFWFGRGDHVYPDFKPVIEKLMVLRDAGTLIRLCEGNHDFFLGDYFAAIPGITVCRESAVVDLEGRKTLVAHGDLVDRENRGYLLLRKILRSGLFYRAQRSIHPRVLWTLARISSSMSRELYPQKEEELVRKMLAYAMDRFKEGFDSVILGHSHKPLLKEFVLADGRKTFATLGDWMRHNSYLSYQDGAFRLLYYKSQ
jgi:UDP-2,3-diacylglucosamine hydrolase